MNDLNSIQLCKRCIMDSTVPNILFDEKGECNYCKIHDLLVNTFPRGEQGIEQWNQTLDRIKISGKGKQYDCVVGISGGADSSYLCDLAVEVGLKPLAVHVDNGWNSYISVSNVEKITTQLNIDLETYVINWEEMKDIHRSYIKAGIPWIDTPSDIALQSALYKVAKRKRINYILIGNDFRSEGKQPTEWTYGDGKQLNAIQRRFGEVKRKTFPNFTIRNLFYYGFIKRIKLIRPFYYLDYNKRSAKEFLCEKFDWMDYGGHHHESVITRFAISYWLPKKFQIDKRKVTYSAQIRSGEILRGQALKWIQESPYDPEQMERDKEFVIKKLGFTSEEFERTWNAENKSIFDYPSHYPLIARYSRMMKGILKYILPWRPTIFFEMDVIKSQNKQNK